MQHLDEGTIHAWLDGALSSEESARVEQHSRQCAECAAMVADARGLIAGASRIVSSLDVVPGGVIPKAKPPVPAPARSVWRVLHLTPFRAALAASLMVAVGSLFVVRRSNDAKYEMTAAFDAPMPAASAPAPAPVVPSSAQVGGVSELRKRSEPSPQRDTVRALAATNQAARQDTVAKPKAATDVAANAVADSTRPVTPLREIAGRPAAPVVADQRMLVDSAAAKVAQAPAPPAAAGAGRGGRGGVAGGRAVEARREAMPLELSRVQTTALGFAPSDDFAGCFRVNVDSALWPRPLPARFSLGTDSVTRQRIVRVDSAPAGNWRPLGTGTGVVVTLTGRDPRATTQFSLTRVANEVIAQRVDGASIRTIPVIRETCRR